MIYQRQKIIYQKTSRPDRLKNNSLMRNRYRSKFNNVKTMLPWTLLILLDYIEAKQGIKTEKYILCQIVQKHVSFATINVDVAS